MAHLLDLLFLTVSVIIIMSLFLNYVPIGLMLTAQAAGVADVSAIALIRMRLRRIPQERVVLPLIAAAKAGVPLMLNQLEAHYLAGGHVDRVVQALIAAKRTGLPLSFEKAADMDLSGDDPVAAVKAAHAGQRTIGE